MTSEDFPAIARVFGAVEELAFGEPSRLDADIVSGWFHGLDLSTNSWAFEEDGTLVAATFVQVRNKRGVSAGAVLPAASGRGYGSRLLELVEARAAEEGATRLHSYAVAPDIRAAELCTSHGYREVRRFWEMAIDLDDDPPEPSVEIDVFRAGDERAFHAAIQEAFDDHWEHEEESFERWWDRQTARPGFDTSVWFMIRDGGEIAAVCKNDMNFAGGGHVGALGVRRPWRGRGYGRALLQHSFREFRRRGMTRASLGVDSSNPTGATHLYESVGMHVELEECVWEKILA